MRAQRVPLRGPWLASAAAVGLAVAVRAVWIPLERHRFDGHETDYLRAFLGESGPASTRLYPLLAGLYRALGALSDDPRVLLGLNLAAGVLLVGVAAGWVGRRAGPAAAWGVGILLALSPAHAAWSASAYNVILPQLALVAGCALGGWGGAALYALGCACRVELAALAPAVALVADRRVALGALGALGAWPALGAAPDPRPLGLVLPANLPLTAYLGPLGQLPGLVLVGLAVHRGALPWLGAAAWTHLVGACFDDQGTRHGLFGGLCLAATVASAPGLRRWLTLPAAVWLLWGLVGLRGTFYADAASFRAALPPDLPRLDGPPEGCVEVLDDPVDPRSHWNLRGGWGVPERWPRGEDGLRRELCWGEEAIHRAWTSRGLDDRALRMHTLYSPVLLGVWERPGGPRLIWRLEP